MNSCGRKYKKYLLVKFNSPVKIHHVTPPLGKILLENTYSWSNFTREYLPQGENSPEKFTRGW